MMCDMCVHGGTPPYRSGPSSVRIPCGWAHRGIQLGGDFAYLG